MYQKTTALILILAAIALAGCASEEKTAAVGSEPAPPPPPTDVVYAHGFFDLERDAGGSWRWMEPEGVVRLKNTGKDMVLKVAGRVPFERFKQAPTIKITLNGAELDQSPATPELMTREFTITPKQQGSGDWSELKISSDKSFVPKETDPGATDPRRLAFSLTKLSWEPK
jgi:hypothetical protein